MTGKPIRKWYTPHILTCQQLIAGPTPFLLKQTSGGKKWVTVHLGTVTQCDDVPALLNWNIITWSPAPQWHYCFSFGNHETWLRLFRNQSTYGVNNWPKNITDQHFTINSKSGKCIFYIISKKTRFNTFQQAHSRWTWLLGLHKHMLNQTFSCSSFLLINHMQILWKCLWTSGNGLNTGQPLKRSWRHECWVQCSRLRAHGISALHIQRLETHRWGRWTEVEYSYSITKSCPVLSS